MRVRPIHFSLCVPWFLAACAASRHSTTIRAENDDLPLGGDDDRRYTQGLRMDFTAEFGAAPDWARRVARCASALDLSFLDARTREPSELGGFVAQQIYTPDDITDPHPGADDRPYAGWLHAGMRVTSVALGHEVCRNDTQTTLELSVGTTGEPSLAEAVQKRWHELLDLPRPRGWDRQVDGEPTIQIGSQHSRRVFYAGEDDGAGCDVLVRGLYNAGNYLTNVGGGATLRAGWVIPRDFTVLPMEPSTKDALVPARAPRSPAAALDVSLYAFAGVEGRAVIRNLSLDGSTFWGGPSVDREPFVGDFTAGLAIRIGGLELGYASTVRSSEFEEQDDSHRFSTVFVRLSFLD